MDFMVSKHTIDILTPPFKNGSEVVYKFTTTGRIDSNTFVSKQVRKVSELAINKWLTGIKPCSTFDILVDSFRKVP